MDTGYDKRNRRLKIFFQVFKMPTTAKQIYEERESRYKMTKLKIGRYRKKERWRDGNIKKRKRYLLRDKKYKETEGDTGN